MAIAEHIKEKGCELVSISEGINTVTPAGRLMFNTIAAVSEFGVDEAAYLTKEALAFKKSCGERTGKVPYGATLLKDGKTLVTNEQEQHTLGLIWSYHKDGLSMRGISKALADQGILSRTKTPFSPSTIKFLIERLGKENA